MAFFGASRRVGRRTARRTSRRWGMMGQVSQGGGPEEAAQAQPQQAQPQQQEDPVKLLQTRLAKGEITPEQYQASLKALQGT
jgi:hypothetical protein